MNKVCQFIQVGILAYLLAACANVIAPAGGPKDELPPLIVAENSTPNLQTKFTKQTIELTFNEWVELKDVFNQVVISPPLEFPYKLKIKRKSVLFEFDEKEVLRPDATYTINFGEAIQDLNERNPADNLRFVFSTGDYIDSLKVTGQVVDAQTSEPLEGILFMLYENIADSVVRTERPFYFGKTNKAGQFLIENVKAGQFKGFALKDADLNYKFNQNTEMIGFPDTLLLVGEGQQPNVQIRMFQEARVMRISEVDTSRFGLIKLSFNQPPTGISYQAPDFSGQLIEEYDKDTLKLWYPEGSSEVWPLFVNRDTLLKDTIQIPVRSKENFVTNATLKSLHRPQKKAVRLAPGKPMAIEYAHPLVSYDTALIHLVEDTLHIPVIPQLSFDTLAGRNLWLSFPWKENMPYELEVLPGAVTDIFGLTNVDTVRQSYVGDVRKNFGNLILTLSGLDSTASYIVQLLFQEKNQIAELKTQGTTVFNHSFNLLIPGDYTLRIITDWNGNGYWDTGFYDDLRQPEPIFRKKLQQLRANWDVEAEVVLGVMDEVVEEEKKE
ncbi:MAG: hypothetical protein DHS20C18_32780 [Saprospiraceae bacterium]|nr:MAG: hypothetical protein DHS20C18_32780 [Saprospiraceae bacterium]